jgi:hypothetical protein
MPTSVSVSGGASPPRSSGKATASDRLRGLARRCRVASEETAMPEISLELVHIAEALDDEATSLAER